MHNTFNINIKLMHFSNSMEKFLFCAFFMLTHSTNFKRYLCCSNGFIYTPQAKKACNNYCDLPKIQANQVC